jgi:hypothetical protein
MPDVPVRMLAAAFSAVGLIQGDSGAVDSRFIAEVLDFSRYQNTEGIQAASNLTWETGVLKGLHC